MTAPVLRHAWSTRVRPGLRVLVLVKNRIRTARTYRFLRFYSCIAYLPSSSFDQSAREEFGMQGKGENQSALFDPKVQHDDGETDSKKMTTWSTFVLEPVFLYTCSNRRTSHSKFPISQISGHFLNGTGKKVMKPVFKNLQISCGYFFGD